MEELFRRGVMRMGPAANDPSRQVGVFNLELLSTLPELRRSEMDRIRWVVGDWHTRNKVPASSQNPEYTDIGTGAYKLCEKDNWICRVDRGGNERRYITFDPFSRQWMYILIEGAYGIMRSSGWIGDSIAFQGHMTMIGVDCEMRQTWTKITDDQFGFVNEELLPDGSWGYVDEWEFRRK